MQTIKFFESSNVPKSKFEEPRKSNSWNDLLDLMPNNKPKAIMPHGQYNQTNNFASSFHSSANRPTNTTQQFTKVQFSAVSNMYSTATNLNVYQSVHRCSSSPHMALNTEPQNPFHQPKPALPVQTQISPKATFGVGLNNAANRSPLSWNQPFTDTTNISNPTIVINSSAAKPLEKNNIHQHGEFLVLFIFAWSLFSYVNQWSLLFCEIKLLLMFNFS